MATGRGAGAAGKRERHGLGLFVLCSPFFSRKQQEHQRRASGAEDSGHGERALESVRERDRKRSAAVQCAGHTAGGDGREDRQPQRSADLDRL